MEKEAESPMTLIELLHTASWALIPFIFCRGNQCSSFIRFLASEREDNVGLSAKMSFINRKRQEIRDQDQRELTQPGKSLLKRWTSLGWEEGGNKGRGEVCGKKNFYY